MRLVPLLVVTLVVAGCHTPPAVPAPRVHGIRVSVHSAEGRARGELLAVSEDSLWILPAAATRVVALPAAGATVQPLEGSELRPHYWASIGGLLTGVGMTVACYSYEGEGACVLMFPVMLGLWHVVGLAARLFMLLDPADPLDAAPASLRRFARFPAGLPPGFRASLPGRAGQGTTPPSAPR